MRRRLGPLLALLVLAGCGKKQDEPDRAPPAEPAGTSASAEPASGAPGTPVADEVARRRELLVPSVTACTTWLRGLVLDLAAPHAFELGAYRLAPKAPPQVVERGGRNVVVLDQPTHELEFWLPEPLEKVAATFHVRTLGPERLSLAVDGQRLGTVDVSKPDERTVSMGPRNLSLARGRHSLRIQRSKRAKSDGVEMSWVRLSESVDQRASSEPLGAEQIEDEVTLGEEPVRAWVFRDRMQLRCPLWVDSPGTRLLAKLGVWGEAEAHFDVNLVYPDQRERLLFDAHFEKGPEGRVQTLDSGPLGIENAFVELVFRARKIGAASRLVLSRPEVEWAPERAEPPPRAERAFIFLLSGLSPKYAPPHAAELGLPVLQEFAAEAVRYPDYRVHSSTPTAAVGSLLTGRYPWVHGALDPEHALKANLATLATWFESEGGRAALFTGVPHSFSSFGFGRGFERVEEISPTEDRPATAPLSAFREWLQAKTQTVPRALGVIHLRGGHPPFDISREQAQLLPPAEYGGDLEPRRAAIQLENVRSRPRKNNRILPDEDWLRLDALRKAALEEQNLALRQTFEELRRLGLWDQSLVVVVGDVGSQDRPHVPFAERAPLPEAELGVPLFIKFPKSAERGQEVKGNVSPIDVFETIARALRLPNEVSAPGAISLFPGASPTENAERRPHIAYFEGSYAARLGPYLLRGTDGKAPTLCRLDWDPGCAQDRASEDPLATSLLWAHVQAEVSPLFEPAATRPPPLELPEMTKNALVVWGASQ